MWFSWRESCEGHYAAAERLVSRPGRLVAIEIADELLHPAQIAAEHIARVGVLDRPFAAHMPDHPVEWRGVESRAARDLVGERDLVRRRRAAVQPHEGAEDGHDRARAR